MDFRRHLDVLGIVPSTATMEIEIIDIDDNTVASGSLEGVTICGSSITGSVTVAGEACQLWWPQGFGLQTLYYFKISVIHAGRTIASIKKRCGFRTIVLDKEPISDAQLAQEIAPGNNWHFEINGHEFYAKGSNLILPDAFWPRVTHEKMEQLFESVVHGNQTCSKSGQVAYAPDFIYDIVDETGVLLWSEFEFGDALYPVDAQFLNNVQEKAIYNVRRINHHPSLTLWAGGNELENLELLTAEAADQGNDNGDKNTSSSSSTSSSPSSTTTHNQSPIYQVTPQTGNLSSTSPSPSR